MPRYQCRSCGTVIVGTRKQINIAKKAKCPNHQVKVVQAKPV